MLLGQNGAENCWVVRNDAVCWIEVGVARASRKAPGGAPDYADRRRMGAVVLQTRTIVGVAAHGPGGKMTRERGREREMTDPRLVLFTFHLHK